MRPSLFLWKAIMNSSKIDVENRFFRYGIIEGNLEVKKLLKDTGERIIPDKMNHMNNMLIEHVARYHFASLFVQGRVLDFACGSGYGTHILAKKCKEKVSEVVGVDINENALEYAAAKYYHPQSLFKQANVVAANVPEQLGEFDCVVSFETIEHVNEEKQFMNNIYQLLKPGGTLIISTPFGKGRGIPCKNPYHVHQLTETEFQHLFSRFTATSFYYQANALILPAESKNDVSFPIGIAVCEK